ncbi:hypothetical protein [Halobacillus sp. H74]|uniref:hypothetical protein n=1 Tax=Halobacillus sp. H74 TaxID=3457436 RepID=UPI003FCD0ACD
MQQDSKQPGPKSNFSKFKELWFLLFMLLFTVIHNVMDHLLGDSWNYLGYGVVFLVIYILFRYMRLSLPILRKQLSWGSLIGFYVAGVFLLGFIMLP